MVLEPRSCEVQYPMSGHGTWKDEDTHGDGSRPGAPTPCSLTSQIGQPKYPGFNPQPFIYYVFSCCGLEPHRTSKEAFGSSLPDQKILGVARNSQSRSEATSLGVAFIHVRM